MFQRLLTNAADLLTDSLRYVVLVLILLWLLGIAASVGAGS